MNFIESHTKVRAMTIKQYKDKYLSKEYDSVADHILSHCIRFSDEQIREIERLQSVIKSMEFENQSNDILRCSSCGNQYLDSGRYGTCCDNCYHSGNQYNI